jgi:hypothetical protein
LLILSNVAAFTLMVVVNGLAGSTTLIGGQMTADVSDANRTLITPAGYVFAIWGIIHFLLAVFVIHQMLPSQQAKAFQKQIGWLFVLSSILNMIWLFAWQYEQLPLSVLIMLLLLGSLIAIYLRLDIGRAKAGIAEKLAVHVPFSTYLGWITIATIANVASTLVSIDWDGFGIAPETWATIIIVIALAIAVLVVVTRTDIAYSLVIIWAFIGIAAEQGSHQNMVLITWASAAVVAAAVVASVVYTVIRGTRTLS